MYITDGIMNDYYPIHSYLDFDGAVVINLCFRENWEREVKLLLVLYDYEVQKFFL